MIVLVTLPFLGHYTAIKRIAEKLINEHFLIVLLSWKDFAIPKETCPILSENRIILETDYEIDSPDPTNFNWKRANQLTPHLIDVFKRLQPIRLVIYDFFCVEAHVAAKRLRFNSVCCIPAIPFEFSLQQNPLILKNFQDVTLNRAAVSDFLMINDPFETKWLTCSPSLQLDVAYLGEKTIYVDIEPNRKPIDSYQNIDIYVCFGTVVTGNLFKNSNDEFKCLLTKLYEKICLFAKSRNLQILIAIPGQDAFDYFSKELQDYKECVKITTFVDQIEILQTCKVFVTHGGGNSVTEAINCRVPMFCIPFFGDQWASSKHINKCNFGVAFPEEMNLVTTTNQCVQDTDMFKRKISFCDNFASFYEDREQFSNNITLAKQKYLSDSFENALKQKLAEPEMRWCDGDLLFGTSLDRQNFCNLALDHLPDFYFNRFFRQTTKQKFPPLLDHYHDFCYENQQLGDKPNVFSKDIVERYKASQPHELHGKQVATMTHSEIVSACCAGIDFFLKDFPNNVIHFIVGPDFMNNKSSVAHDELDHIRRLYCQKRAVFYCFNINNDRALIRVDVKQMFWFNWSIQNVDRVLKSAEHSLQAMVKMLKKDILKHSTNKFGGALLEYRVKSRESLLANFAKNRFISSDIIGLRIIHPFTASLFLIAQMVENQFNVLSKRVSERGRVIHMLITFCYVVFELQFWPSVLHSCFMAEHDTVYKCKTRLTEKQLFESNLLREKEHKVQDMIDSMGPLIQN